MKKKLFYWTSRILAIIAIMFMMVFSLDCFEGASARDIFICFVMHNIPAFIIIAVLIIAWKWELIGGILFIAVSIAGTVYFNHSGDNWGVLIVMTPFLLTGMLFILHDYLYIRRK